MLFSEGASSRSCSSRGYFIRLPKNTSRKCVSIYCKVKQIALTSSYEYTKRLFVSSCNLELLLTIAVTIMPYDETISYTLQILTHFEWCSIHQQLQSVKYGYIKWIVLLISRLIGCSKLHKWKLYLVYLQHHYYLYVCSYIWAYVCIYVRAYLYSFTSLWPAIWFIVITNNKNSQQMPTVKVSSISVNSSESSIIVLDGILKYLL